MIRQNYLNPFIDFFYFDVLSSVREFKLAIEAIECFNKPYLIGAHISEGVKLPSGENISEIITALTSQKFTRNNSFLCFT